LRIAERAGVVLRHARAEDLPAIDRLTVAGYEDVAVAVEHPSRRSSPGWRRRVRHVLALLWPRVGMRER